MVPGREEGGVVSKKKGDTKTYLLIHSGLLGCQQFTWFDDLDAARRRLSAYKELGMVTTLTGIYLKVDE